MKKVKDYQREAREKLLTAGADGFTIDLDVEALDTLIATICGDYEGKIKKLVTNIDKGVAEDEHGFMYVKKSVFLEMVKTLTK